MNYLVLSPKHLNCTPYYPNTSNITNGLNSTTSKVFIGNITYIVMDNQIRRIEPVYDYSQEYGRSVLTDVRKFSYLFLNESKRGVLLISCKIL